MRRSRAAPLRRVLAWLVGGALVLALLLVTGAAGALWWTLPARNGSLAMPGLSAPASVSFDGDGIPRVAAANELDAARVLGALHARDRLFQMEMMRRGGSGRLAEVAGPAALRLDRFTRLLGLARRAEADLAALPPDTRALLDAYAAGVNAWITARGRFSAPEFLFLGVPEPWTPRDSLLWGKVMGLYLSGNWRTELERARLAGALSPERLRELWPEDESDGRAEVASLPPPLRGLDRLLAALPRFPGDAPLPDTASNAWAVSAARSATGGALLASDPHLGFGAPILWYLARVDLPDGRFLAGATAPGVPFVVIGRSDRLAWGFTTTHSDTQDVFVERPVGADSYETPQGPRAFSVREELIAVRGQPPVPLRVRESRHGPVVSDLEPAENDAVLAVSMANLAPADTAAAGLHALNRARGLADARAAAALITSPSQNLTVADRAGGVAMFLTGRTPVRAFGDGSAPAPGWDGARDWTGWVPFDDLPHVVEPASGAVANANNRVQPRDSAAFLGRDWPGDWRFRRVAEMLGARERHGPGDFAAMQNDAVSLLARDLLPLLRRIPRPAGRAGDARDLLLGWDGSMTPDRPQPLIFNAWLREAGRAALAAGGVPENARDPSPEFMAFVLHPDGRGAHWCGAGGCDALAAAALERAVEGLAARFGPEPGGWRWGAAHVARFEHPLLRFLPVLGRWSTIEVPTSGDGETVNRGGYRDGFAHVHGAGLRLVADLSSPDGAWAAIATGQSGHPLSAHWGDLNGRWAAGRMVPLGRDAPSAGTLRVVPGG